MAIPFHQYASTPVAMPASVAAERLTAAPVDHLTSATGSALHVIAPAAERLGLSPCALPGTRARLTDAEEFGAVELVWDGDEQLTGWPSLVARLLVIPEPDGNSRLVLMSTRAPEADLRVEALDRIHRVRVVDLALQRFLYDLSFRLVGRVPSEPSAPARRSDDTPLFLHHEVATATDPDELRRALVSDAPGLADRATAAALSRASGTLAAGGFRAAAAPTVEGRAATPGELGAMRIGWRSDEEATGWPTMEFVLVVATGADGARLSILSPRQPGYDMSLNRIDRHQRDQLLREAGARVVEAVLAEAGCELATTGSGAVARSLVTSGAR